MSETDEITPNTYEIIVDNNYIHFRLQEGEDMTTQINNIVKDYGIGIENIEYPIPVYYIHLGDNFGQTLDCGNIISTFFTALKSVVDEAIIVIDFDGVTEISENFCGQYCKYLLSTKNKIITINQDINVSNIFAYFILTNIDVLEMEE